MMVGLDLIMVIGYHGFGGHDFEPPHITRFAHIRSPLHLRSAQCRIASSKRFLHEEATRKRFVCQEKRNFVGIHQRGKVGQRFLEVVHRLF